jgi:hypothetical protein
MTKSRLAMGINSCFLKVVASNLVRDDKTYSFYKKNIQELIMMDTNYKVHKIAHGFIYK